MILYTIIPPDAVMEGYFTYQPQYRELMVGEARVIYEEEAPGEGRLVRLISPRMEDYLDPRYQPGRKLYLGWNL